LLKNRLFTCKISAPSSKHGTIGTNEESFFFLIKIPYRFFSLKICLELFTTTVYTVTTVLDVVNSVTVYVCIQVYQNTSLFFFDKIYDLYTLFKSTMKTVV
jgi:hypothetical protein